MKFRVEWMPVAVDDLTSIWLAATPLDRRAIAAAAQDVELQLERKPATIGESRSGGKRITFQPPLAVVYRIQPRMSLVHVVEVWRTRPPRRRGHETTDN